MTAPGDPDGSLLTALAQPRLAGSAAVRDVEETVSRRLKDLGYDVSEQPFVTDARRLIAPAIGAAGMGWSALLSAPLLVTGFAPPTSALVVVTLLVLVGLVTHGLATGRLPFPQPEVQARNLIATRGEPAVWLVAHSDSKAQGASMAGRVVALVLLGTGVGAVALLALFNLVVPAPDVAVIAAAGCAAVGGAILSRAPLKADAPGAVDNATGLVAVLRAASLLADRSDVGVLITGAEELGMAGARVWVGEGREGVFVNFDGLDDRGTFNVMPHGQSALTDRVVTHLASAGTVRHRPLPIGIFVDGGVLAAAGMQGCTVSGGDWQTLRIVHTRRDTADRLTGEAARTAGEAAASAIRAVLG